MRTNIANRRLRHRQKQGNKKDTMQKVTPKQRSLKYLRDRGFDCWDVEKFIGAIKCRQDCFGFGDILAINMDDTVMVQTTTGSNVAAHITKILENKYARKWLMSSRRHIVVHGWRMIGDRGKRKTWQVREEWIRLDRFAITSDMPGQFDPKKFDTIDTIKKFQTC